MCQLCRFASFEGKEEYLRLAVGGTDEGDLFAVGTPGRLAGAFPGRSELTWPDASVGRDQVQLVDIFIIPFGSFCGSVGFDGGEREDGKPTVLAEMDISDRVYFQKIGEFDGFLSRLCAQRG